MLLQYQSSSKKLLQQRLPQRDLQIEKIPLRQWDSGVFNHELIHTNATTCEDGDQVEVGGRADYGCYAGTQLALTEVYKRVEQAYGTYFDAIGFERTMVRSNDLKRKQDLFQFKMPIWDPQNDEYNYPPHLDIKNAPGSVKASQSELFNDIGLRQVALLFPRIIPKNFESTVKEAYYHGIRELEFGDPSGDATSTIADIEELNRRSPNRQYGTDVMGGVNIGDYDDWYSDEKFAQQQFTGNNPTTITVDKFGWVPKFKKEARRQRKEELFNQLRTADPESLYVQDCSWYREAIGVDKNETMTTSDGRWSCASVALFQLHPDGRLHPLAIIIDYKGSMSKSVTIFNQRVTPKSSKKTEKTDWPWRYAKTCVQMSDWAQQAIIVHLVNTHMIEEVTIVATHRQIPEDHIIFKLLSPHWIKTLSLNAAARATLMPKVIAAILGWDGSLTGKSPTQPFKFIQYGFKHFDFQGKYVPADLKARGFDPAHLESKKFCNYVYGKNMYLMWHTIHSFVDHALRAYIASDEDVANDQHIQAWSAEIRSENSGQIPTFPEIKTLDALADAITMCIHLASPQHTAVNYLQHFYQSFVINKPPVLYSCPPQSLKELEDYVERDLIKALPIGKQREWLLASQLPWLLSWRVAEELSIKNYALSLWTLYKKKTVGRDAALMDMIHKNPKHAVYLGLEKDGEHPMKTIAKDFYLDLEKLDLVFREYSLSQNPRPLDDSIRSMPHGTITVSKYSKRLFATVLCFFWNIWLLLRPIFTRLTNRPMPKYKGTVPYIVMDPSATAVSILI